MGAMVIRVTPDGAVDRRIRVPVEKPTMPAFGGPDRATLFITTIGGGGSHAVDPSQALAGGLFAVDVGVRGMPETPFEVAHRSRRHDGDDPAAGVVRTPGDPRPRRDGRGGLHGPRAGDRGRSVLGRGDGCGRRRRSGAFGEVAMDRAPALVVIARTGIGYDAVDVAAATRRGIAVCNTPDGPTVSTAEHAVTLMLLVAKKVKAAEGALRAGTAGGYYSRHHGIELDGKVLGLVGFGRIARHVARVADGLGMHVMFFDPYLPVSAVADGIVAPDRSRHSSGPRTWSRSTSR